MNVPDSLSSWLELDTAGTSNLGCVSQTPGSSPSAGSHVSMDFKNRVRSTSLSDETQNRGPLCLELTQGK